MATESRPGDVAALKTFASITPADIPDNFVEIVGGVLGGNADPIEEDTIRTLLANPAVNALAHYVADTFDDDAIECYRHGYAAGFITAAAAAFRAEEDYETFLEAYIEADAKLRATLDEGGEQE